jgi:hypothetical protein
MLLVLLLQGGPVVAAAAAVWSTLSTRFFPHYMMSTYLNNRRCIGAARAAVQMVKWDTRT